MFAQQAIKRLGKSSGTAGMSASERLKLKKQQKLAGGSVAAPDAAAEKASRERMLQLTEYADKLLTAGHPNAYDATRESIDQQRAVRLLLHCNYQLLIYRLHSTTGLSKRLHLMSQTFGSFRN